MSEKRKVDLFVNYDIEVTNSEGVVGGSRVRTSFEKSINIGLFHETDQNLRKRALFIVEKHA